MMNQKTPAAIGRDGPQDAARPPDLSLASRGQFMVTGVVCRVADSDVTDDGSPAPSGRALRERTAIDPGAWVPMPGDLLALFCAVPAGPPGAISPRLPSRRRRRSPRFLPTRESSHPRRRMRAVQRASDLALQVNFCGEVFTFRDDLRKRCLAGWLPTG